jgi:hypothetical protein
MTRRTVAARVVADLGAVLEGWNDPVAIGVGLDGAIYATARRSSERLTVEQGIGIFPKSQLQQPSDWIVVESRAGHVRSMVIPSESTVFTYVQPFRDGVLLAGARCRWHAGGAERNAVGFDWTGRETGRLVLGDGIQDLRVTSDGTIWVSYFDEGIFGNFGWGEPGPAPLGGHGLASFSADGELRFAYDSAAAGTDAICDAYAINVARNGDVCVYFYTEFPIVRIRDGRYQVWKLGARGARGLAVREDRFLLFGDYQCRNLLRYVEPRTAGRASVVAEAELISPEGGALDDASACGIGETLFLFQGRRILALDDW